MMRRWWCLLAVVAAVVGCSEPEETNDALVVAPRVSIRGASVPSPIPPGASLVTDARGRQWALTKTHTAFSASSDKNARIGKGPAGPTRSAILGMSEADLAELLRPVMLVGRYEYTLAQPNLEGARAVRASLQMNDLDLSSSILGGRAEAAKRGGTLGIGPRVANPTPSRHQMLLGETSVRSDVPTLPTREIYGTDERVFVAPTSVGNAPVASAVVLDNESTLSTDSDCSAILVGSGTALSAAHCFYNQSTEQWVSTRTWGAGVVNRVKQSVFGPVYQKPRVYGPVTGCYSVYLPAAFVQGENDQFFFDLAVIDFRYSECSEHTPGTTAGFVPPTTAEDSGIAAAYSIFPAYDSDLPYQSPAATWQYFLPTVLNRSGAPGRVWADSIESHLLLHDLDMTGGSSGGGIVQNAWIEYGDFDHYVTSVNVGAVLRDSLQNAGRKFDFFFAALLANAVDYQ